MANKSPLFGTSVTVIDGQGPAAGTMFAVHNIETGMIDVTTTRPTIDADGQPLTGLRNEFLMASRDPAFAQALSEQNYEEAIRLASVQTTNALTDADAGSSGVWSYPAGTAGVWYVGGYFNDAEAVPVS